jgi:signal transduction histidine kinase
MSTRFRFLCWFILLCWTGVAHAQTFKITRYGVKDSLEAVAVHDISQDSAGFIWIAGDEGLQRYNGNHFLNVHRDSLTFLSYQERKFIAGHRELFSFTSNYPFDSFSLETLPIKSRNALTKNNLFFADKQVIWWSDDDGIHSHNGKEQTNFDFITGTKKSRFFFASMKNSFYAVESEGQLFHLFTSENLFVPLVGGNIHSKVNAVLSYSDSLLIVATDEDLLMLTIKGGDLLGNQVLSRENGFRHVTKDKRGNIWATTSENRLFKFYPHKGRFVMRRIQDGSEPHRIADLRLPEMKKLFIDRHDNLWVCHAEGVALVSEIPFVVADPELPNEIIRSAAFMDEGKAYLSGFAGFFETVNMGFNDYEVRPAKLGRNVYPNAICRCEDRLWVGTVDDEVFYYENGKLSKPLYASKALNIFYMFCDSRGEVWVSRGQKNKPVRGILKIRKDMRVTEYDERYGFSTRMLVTKQGPGEVVYVAGIGEDTYLYRYDRDRDSFTNLSLEMKFDYGENFEVHDFVVSSDTTFWLASTAGLLVLKGDSIRKVEIDELYGREVVAVTLSKDDVVWASTEKDGLIRYISDQDYSIFNIEAGLQSGIMWYRSLFTDTEGKLWAGSREGITVSSHPNPVAKETEIPVLLSVIDKGVSNIRKHVFNFASTLTVGFVSLTYPSRSVEYQYRLNDERSWRTLREKNSLVLSEMPSGQYTLYIRARQAGGYYWSKPLRYSFTILQPWYFSREAFLIYAIFFVSMAVLGMRLYNRRLLIEKNRLEVKIRDRTQELIKKQEEIIAQNQELHQLSDVLAANHENIVTQKEIIEKQNFMLHQAKFELEKKVEERTHELKFANEELAQQNVQLEQFAFMTAHNLRAPVARLLGLTSLLEMNGSTPNADQAELLKRIQESSKSLDETIREISEILHIKKGLHGSFTNVNLKSVWDRILPSFASEIAANHIDIESSLQPHHVIKGVEPFVYSVFYNVISNSIKYSDNRKKSHIRITTEETDENIFVIADDNGIGFNSSLYTDKLFKPFTRFNNIKEGRGLGLYLMKIQMEMMGGDIELISHLNEGTRITLRFVRVERSEK